MKIFLLSFFLFGQPAQQIVSAHMTMDSCITAMKPLERSPYGFPLCQILKVDE